MNSITSSSRASHCVPRFDDGIARVKLADESDLLQIAKTLGEPLPSTRDGTLVETLKVMPSESGHSNSMTSRFGMGSFPLHTDQAFKRRPPHYILLYHAPPITSRGTTFVSLPAMEFTNEELEYLRRGVWSVATGNSTFLSPILSTFPNMTSPILRYDPCIMNPICPFARRAADAIARVILSLIHI